MCALGFVHGDSKIKLFVTLPHLHTQSHQDSRRSHGHASCYQRILQYNEPRTWTCMCPTNDARGILCTADGQGWRIYLPMSSSLGVVTVVLVSVGKQCYAFTVAFPSFIPFPFVRLKCLIINVRLSICAYYLHPSWAPVLLVLLIRRRTCCRMKRYYGSTWDVQLLIQLLWCYDASGCIALSKAKWFICSCKSMRKECCWPDRLQPLPILYQQAMQEAGFDVKFIPTLHFDFVSQRELSDAVSNPSHYSGICVHFIVP